jgi:ABC-type phosphate transport system substrate-binding protein
LYLQVLLFIGTTVHAVNDTNEELRGATFTEPTKIFEMDADWTKKPITYDSSIENADLVITLGQHLYPIAEPIIKKYAKEHGLKIFINEGTCGISAGMLSRKAADIGGYCCPPGETDRLPGLKFHTIGIAALALFVNHSNPLDNVSIEQARQIFSGEINRWSEVKIASGEKGSFRLIQPVARLHCKLRPGHWKLLLANEDLFSPSIQEVGAIQDMIEQVSKNPMAIGYESITSIYRYYPDEIEFKVKALKINGYAHNEPSDLLNGNYSLYRVLSLTTWEGKNVQNPLAEKLVNYLIQEVEHFDSKLGIVPVSQIRKAGWKFYGNELNGEPE